MAEQPPGVGVDGELRRLQQAVTINLLPILAARINSLLWDQNDMALSGLRQALSLVKRVAIDSLVATHLYDAVSDCNPESYRTGYARSSRNNRTRLGCRHPNTGGSPRRAIRARKSSRWLDLAPATR
jgi:hypothetical protein